MFYARVSIECMYIDHYITMDPFRVISESSVLSHFFSVVRRTVSYRYINATCNCVRNRDSSNKHDFLINIIRDAMATHTHTPARARERRRILKMPKHRNRCLRHQPRRDMGLFYTRRERVLVSVDVCGSRPTWLTRHFKRTPFYFV